MRTILISGASRGIGLNIAHKELKEGNRISIGIRDLESLKGSAIDPKKWPEGKIIINHSLLKRNCICNVHNVYKGAMECKERSDGNAW